MNSIFPQSYSKINGFCIAHAMNIIGEYLYLCTRSHYDDMDHIISIFDENNKFQGFYSDPDFDKNLIFTVHDIYDEVLYVTNNLEDAILWKDCKFKDSDEIFISYRYKNCGLVLS